MTTPELLTGHEGAVRAIAVSPDGSTLVTGGDDGKVRAWNLGADEGELRAEDTRHKEQVLAVAVTGDGSVVSCDSRRAGLWRDGNKARSLAQHPAHLIAASISAGGDVIAGVDIGERVVLQRPEARSWPAGHQRVDSIAVSVERRVITAGSGPIVRVTDWSGAELGRLDGHTAGNVAVAASDDGTRIAFGIRDAVRFWDTTRDEPIDLIGCDDTVVAVAVTPDGRRVIAGGFGGGIWAWDPDKPAKPIRMRGHEQAVRAFAVTPEPPRRRRLVSGAEDGTLRIWHLATGSEVTPGRRRRELPNLSSDQESTIDLLGSTEDVESMATLITDRWTQPPLAIALLGRWGSGKSSFMRQLQDRVAWLAKQGASNSASSVFATSVRQVRFDAWHFADDQLWVGMVEHLFAELAEPAPPDAESAREEPDALRERLRNLEVLSDTNQRPTRRLRARLRLLTAGLARRRAQIAVTGGAVALLGSVAGLSWWLSGGAVVAWILAVLTPAPLLPWLVKAVRAIRGLAASRAGGLAQEVRETRIRLARLDATQRLALAIEEARSTGGYDQYRGLLGRVHADLRRLSESARQAYADWERAEPVTAPPLERVILYVDDLDRCSPRKVVDVLAAVHLLLALPLFVVVVAVDPRWLRRCLEQYHSELFGETGDEPGGATPVDYLDKIFQVVFALPPMGREADRLIDAIVPTVAAETAETAEPVVPGPIQRPPLRDPGRPANPPEEPPEAPSDLRLPMPMPYQLRLHAEEQQFVRRLRPLLETPRQVKRFVNLYRLVRVTVANGELDDFLGADGRGPYQAVLLLLAVLVVAPGESRELTETLRERDDEGELTDLVEELVSERDSRVPDIWTRIRDVLRQGDPIHGNLATYRSWAGTVARFSFETWDLTERR